MLTSLLVGLDGTPFSAAAVQVGIEWAARTGGLLVGLGIIDEPAIRAATPVPLGGGAFKAERDAAVLAEARQFCEQLLSQFSVQCATAGVSSKVLEGVGSPVEKIVQEAQRYDLILLGQQTCFRYPCDHTDDQTLHAVLKDSPRPVVAISKNPQRGDSVVVAYDGSLQAARTLQVFAALAGLRFQHMHLVSIHDDKVEAARRADRAVEFLGFHQIAATPHAISLSSSRAAGEILDQARKLGAGLLVMGAYGQPTLREFFFGSVTQSVLKQAQVPVFLYH
jgi:nucleotide-binding universal stress UspA family protein